MGGVPRAEGHLESQRSGQDKHSGYKWEHKLSSLVMPLRTHTASREVRSEPELTLLCPPFPHIPYP